MTHWKTNIGGDENDRWFCFVIINAYPCVRNMPNRMIMKLRQEVLPQRAGLAYMHQWGHNVGVENIEGGSQITMQYKSLSLRKKNQSRLK